MGFTLWHPSSVSYGAIELLSNV